MRKFASKTLIPKGWSADKKYRVTDESGTEYLLRVSPHEKEARVRAAFGHMRRVEALGIPMCRALDLWVEEEGVCMLQSFIRGDDLREVVNDYPEERQYAWGVTAGEYLRKIHTIPAPADREPWDIFFSKKMDRKIRNYQDCPLKFDGGEAFLRFIEENRYLIQGRPQCYQHGDYHLGNMMVDAAGMLYLIDFDRDDYGDPWEEFNRIVWGAQEAPVWACGLVDGYFDGSVPEEFWRLLALYISSNTLSSLPWAVSFGEGEIHVMRRQAEQVLSWYENMKKIVPSWYRNR